MTLPIFVVNMPRNVERKQSITLQLSSRELSATVIDAVVGKNLSSIEVEQLYDEDSNRSRYHRNLTLGEVGCYASHRKIWKMICEHQHPWALILEDDIAISDAIHQTIEALKYIDNTDIVKLSDNRNNPAEDSRILPNGSACVSYKRVPNCTTGYMISLSGAEKLLSRQRFFRPVDIDMQFHSELNLSLIGVKPYCVSEAGFESEIVAQNQDGKHSNSSTFLRNLLHRIRMMKQRTKVSANLDHVVNIK